MPPQPQPSLKALVAKTVADAQRLAKAQAALLQTEISATGNRIGKGGALGIVTGIMAFFATMFLLLTLAFVLVALGLPVWAGMLIVAVLLIIVGTITGLLAKKNFEQVQGPTVAIAELEKTKAALSGKPAEPTAAMPPALQDAVDPCPCRTPSPRSGRPVRGRTATSPPMARGSMSSTSVTGRPCCSSTAFPCSGGRGVVSSSHSPTRATGPSPWTSAATAAATTPRRATTR